MICILPLGSYEQHGRWPKDLDTKIASKVAEEIRKRVGGELLPPISFSASWEWEDSISLRVETLSMLLGDIASSCKRLGKALVVVNAHGGNSGLVQAIGRQYGFFVVDFWKACKIKVGHCDAVERAVAKELGIELEEQPFEKGWPERKVSLPKIGDSCYGWEEGVSVKECIEAIAEELKAIISCGSPRCPRSGSSP